MQLPPLDGALPMPSNPKVWQRWIRTTHAEFGIKLLGEEKQIYGILLVRKVVKGMFPDANGNIQHLRTSVNLWAQTYSLNVAEVEGYERAYARLQDPIRQGQVWFLFTPREKPNRLAVGRGLVLSLPDYQRILAAQKPTASAAVASNA